MKNSKNSKNSKNINVILLFIILFTLVALVPYVITILFPNICYGCTTIGKIQQYLNKTIYLDYISWFSYIFLFIYFIYLSSKLKNILKYGLIVFCLFMIYLPIFPLLLILNLFLYFIFKNPPFIQNYHSVFPASIEIENNSNTVISEYKRYIENNKPECIRKNNPGFKIENNSINDNCWRIIYLKKIGKIDNDIIQYFPNTIELIKDEQIHNAFFSILDPGVEILPHRGYFKGYLRYHLGVVIPNGNEKAYIMCGGEKHIWEEGKGVVFDDMYTHYVKNPTNNTRVVLYLDIKRKSNYFVNKINNIGINLIENSLLANIFLKNQHQQNKIEDFM
jgi:beta-hydroxylase